jgi:hypothetical protein
VPVMTSAMTTSVLWRSCELGGRIANAGPTLIRLAERGKNSREREYFLLKCAIYFRSKRE